MTSWRGALFPRGERGFADDPYWYDLHVAAEPRYGAALQEVVRAAPPVEPGAAVADLGAGTGALSVRYAQAYPRARLHLIDRSEAKLRRAADKLPGEVLLHEQTLDPEVPATIGSGDYPLIISGLTLHVVAAWDAFPNEADYGRRTQALLAQVLASLRPGGTFIYADFIRHGLGVREHLGLLASAGFVEPDCAWRSGDLGVFGAARPSLSVD
jgi:SAM-dependent methyltransferase